jgi:hypothetical protein
MIGMINLCSIVVPVTRFITDYPQFLDAIVVILSFACIVVPFLSVTRRSTYLPACESQGKWTAKTGYSRAIIENMDEQRAGTQWMN